MLAEKIAQPCLICFSDNAPVYSVLIPCCVQVVCYQCFYKMLRQTLRCPTCRTVYANEPLLALLSVLIRSDSLQASGFISRAALSKQLQEQKSEYCAVVDYDDPVNVSVYKIA